MPEHEHHHHDHEHEAHEHHHHDHGHEDHEHHHADETVLIDRDGAFLSMMDHEGSLVASYRFPLSCSLDEAREQLSQFAVRLSADVDEQGGIVGHIKAFAVNQGPSFRVSVTADEPDVIDFDETSVRVEGVAIVLAVDRAWYEQTMVDRVEALLAQ